MTAVSTRTRTTRTTPAMPAPPATTRRRSPPRPWPALLLALAAATHGSAALAATPADLLAGFSAQAGAPAQPSRGQAFFTTTHGREWSCASCHGAVPTQAGRHASTGKPIQPLAPAFNPARFSDAAKVEKWFRRNCNDVTGRACTPAEQADVLAWLMTLQP